MSTAALAKPEVDRATSSDAGVALKSLDAAKVRPVMPLAPGDCGPAETPRQPRTFRVTRPAYHKMNEVGVFAGRRVELIDGRIVEMPPMGPEHRRSLIKSSVVFSTRFNTDETFVLCQVPTILEQSEPEPDLSVHQGHPDTGGDDPADTLLVVEISKTSLNLDRTVKLRLYAAAPYAEYWIVDLDHRRLIVHRDPTGDDGLEHYTDVTAHADDAEVAPLFAPDTPVKVADLLP